MQRAHKQGDRKTDKNKLDNDFIFFRIDIILKSY